MSIHKMKNFYLSILILAIATVACGSGTPNIPPTPQNSVFDSNETTYGFFPSPPEVTLESVFQNFKNIAKHGDFALIQQNANWEDFVNGVDGESQTRTDIINQVILTRQNNLEYIFVLDALNGLNRREFSGLPAGWDANFANPNVRAAYKNFALWVVQNFHPLYLGLSSEINTYMDAHPEDAAHFVSLYHEVYALIKADAPNTQVFVTFQWDDLNNMWTQPEEGNRTKLQPNWEQIEAFEPNLDLWVISSYPYFVFPGASFPADYYSRLLARTSKLVAVAEGGYSSRDIGGVTATSEDQVAYLNAIHEQLGSRLSFWVYLLLNDFDMESYAKALKDQGVSDTDANTLSMFQSLGLREADGTPKPALEVWMSYREER